MAINAITLWQYYLCKQKLVYCVHDTAMQLLTGPIAAHLSKCPPFFGIVILMTFVRTLSLAILLVPLWPHLGHVQQLTSQIGRITGTKWQRLPAGDTLCSVSLAGNCCHFVLLDNNKSCPTADLSNIGRPNGPAYLTGELLNTPLLLLGQDNKQEVC